MLEQARSKLTTEMDGNKTNSYVQVVGKFLIDHLNSNPGAAEKIMAEGKTIANSLDAMKNEARKKQVNGCGVLTPQEGFDIVLKYYGIDGAAPASADIVVASTPPPATADFDIKLEDLL